MRGTFALLIAASVSSWFAGCQLMLSYEGVDDGRAPDATSDQGRVGAGDVEAADAADAWGDARLDPAEGDAPLQAEAGALDATESAVDGGAQTGDAGDGGPLYLGCFTDSMTRDLPYQAYDSQVSTTTACVAACMAKGYRFAATQSGSQCFCGNAYGGQGPAGGCTTPCTGDATRICGGNFRNSVYVAIGPAPQATYVGCYADGMTRELPDQVFGGPYTTVESCAAGCAYHGYFYAGPENGDQCFCGNTYGAQGPAGGCTNPCTGNSAEVCGGFYANSVYRTWVPADAGTGAGDAASD